MTTPPAAAPGWYPDPSGAPEQRFFDGFDWTEHRAPLAAQQPNGPVGGLALPPPAYRLHSPAGVAWATALGTPAAGGIVLALNYWKWGQKSLAAAAVAAGLLTTGVLFWLAWLAPEAVPAAAFLVPQILGGYFLARSLQGRRFSAHIVSGGKKASNWIGAGIGLAVFAPLIGALVVFVLISGVNPSAFVDMQHSVDMGHDQHVYYSRGATRDDAQRFGEALETEGYFDGTTPADVLISGKAGAREISLLSGGGVWEDESYVEAVRAMAERIAPAIGGKPFTVRILDENLNEKKRLQIE